MQKKIIGKIGEWRARLYLYKQGYRLIAKNFHIRGAEIDIIMRDKKMLVMVEVKTRTSIRKGYPEEAVSTQKIQSMYRLGEALLQKVPDCTEVRCDIVSILIFQHDQMFRIRHFKNVGDF